MHIDGACHCGAISFTAEVDPTLVMVCHCTDCQIMSGTAFRTVIAVPVDKLSFQGEPRRYVKVAESGNRRIQAFCPECGTSLYSSNVENVRWLNMRTGCMKQRAQLRPSAQIWQHSAMPWLAELSSIPGSPKQQAYVAPLPS
jgi:hypothetical protein